MKKIYFLISIIIAFLVPGVISSININIDSNNVINDSEINITSGKYLDLTYQGGRFYSWSQQDTIDQHIIGVFNKDDQSYLLDSSGIFWSLDFQILNFYRISDTNGIAYIKYFKNTSNEEYFNQNFIVTLNDNAITVNDVPIASNNTIFARLDDTHAVAYGIGLESIDVTSNNVSQLIAPYDKGEFPTTFYPIDANDGIFVAGDQSYYLLTNINSGLTQTIIPNLTAPNANRNNVVVIDSNDVVIRANQNSLHFVNINSGSVVVNDWKDQEGNAITSNTNNLAFILSSDTFILNTSFVNSSSRYGAPYLVKIANWNDLIAIPNITTVDNFMIISGNNGIFIDKDLQANTFTYQSSDDSFTLSELGTLNSFQFVNTTLFFGTIEQNNLLVAQEVNDFWSIISNIKFSSRINTTNTNLLNNMITTDSETIDYTNAYFSDGTVNLNITDLSLREVVIEPTNGSIRRLTPDKNNSINFDFLSFDKYQVTITFLTSTGNQNLTYQVSIVNFSNQSLIEVSGINMISYVGVAQKKLYDIKVIDQATTFTINNFNYDYLQYVELYIFEDTTNTVVQNKYNLKANTSIAASTEQFFFGLKQVNLLNQITWTYLGFSKDDINPMIDFWDTDYGKNLMNQAIGHRYLERDLRKMSSQEIIKLISTSRTWTAIAVQGRSIVISVATVFALALAFIVTSIGYNIFLNKRIEIDQVEKNKILKNPLDAQ